MCNNVVLNTTNPQTALEKQVAKELQEIAKTYGLTRKSGSVVFVYPDALVKPDRENPGKFDSPKGITIKYQASEILEDGAGTREWRYFTNSTTDKNGKPIYTPAVDIFNGRWELGLNELELIYYLINIYPYTEGGKNFKDGDRAFMKRKDVAADNRKVVEARSQRAEIEAKLYLKPGKGGFTDEELKDLALRIQINAGTMDLPLSQPNRDSLILMIDNKFKTDPSLTMMAKESQSLPNIDMEIRKLVQQAKDFKLIALIKKGNSIIGWGRLNHTTGTYDKLVGFPVNAKNEDDVLYRFLGNKPLIVESLAEMVALEEAKAAGYATVGDGDGDND